MKERVHGNMMYVAEELLEGTADKSIERLVWECAIQVLAKILRLTTGHRPRCRLTPRDCRYLASQHWPGPSILGRYRYGRHPYPDLCHHPDCWSFFGLLCSSRRSWRVCSGGRHIGFLVPCIVRRKEGVQSNAPCDHGSSSRLASPAVEAELQSRQRSRYRRRSTGSRDVRSWSKCLGHHCSGPSERDRWYTSGKTSWVCDRESQGMRARRRRRGPGLRGWATSRGPWRRGLTHRKQQARWRRNQAPADGDE